MKESRKRPQSSNQDLFRFSRIGISVLLVRDDEMQELNLKYRGKDYPTDVLSFDTKENDGEGLFQLGEIAVNIDQAERQALEFGNDLQHEIAELVEHGVLHLLGVHHEHEDEHGGEKEGEEDCAIL